MSDTIKYPLSAAIELCDQLDKGTPETDAAYLEQKDIVLLCRKLERERDEARDELHDIRKNLGADADGYTLLHAVCVLQNERDDAREEWNEEIKFHHRTHSELVNTNCKMLDMQNDNRQLADRLTELELHSTSELAMLEQERDEAKEEVKLLQAILDIIRKDSQ